MLTGDGEEIGAQADRDALQCKDRNQAQGGILNEFEVTVPECIIDDDPDRLRVKKAKPLPIARKIVPTINRFFGVLPG